MRTVEDQTELLEDAARQVSRRGINKFTRFLDPAQAGQAEQIARNHRVAFSVWGGFEQAERVIGCFHPVGEEVNIYRPSPDTGSGAGYATTMQALSPLVWQRPDLLFRPMSDLPTVEELIEGLKTYIAQAREMGLKVYVGTLIPMGGWRTDAPFRQEMRHAYNDFIRTTDLIDGCIDFDKALRDPERTDWFLPEYDSGDHLHPSKKGYERMAAEVPEELLK